MKTPPSARSTLPPFKNALLCALSADDFQRIAPHLESVPLSLGWALYESGTKMRHMYFPTEGVVSLLTVLEDEFSAEIAVTGNEGLVGVSLFMGGRALPAARSCMARGTRTV